MFPQAGGVWTFKISVGGQMLLQLFVCQKCRPGGVPTCAAHLKVKKLQVCPNYIAFLSMLEIMLMASSNIQIYEVVHSDRSS
jgi:hypothetical protein